MLRYLGKKGFSLIEEQQGEEGKFQVSVFVNGCMLDLEKE